MTHTASEEGRVLVAPVRRWIDCCSLIVALVAGACAGPPLSEATIERVSERGLVSARVHFEPPVARGDNTVLVELSARSGTATPALAAVEALMPAHGHRAHATRVEATAEGFRAERLNLFMTGRWQLELALEIDGATDSVSLPVDVP